MPQNMMTYNDKKLILAAALKVNEWNIDDISDTDVFYTQEPLDEIPGGVRSSYKRPYSIDSGKVTLGESTQVVKRTVFEPIVVVAEFALETEALNDDSSMVQLTGKLFEAGDYPDKGFAITEDELAAAAAQFAPVDNDLEHEPTILSGKLGRLESVAVKGKELLGTVTIPKWLADTVGKSPIKTSLAWSKDAKRIVGNALVLEPRIPDAQLTAAFNAANNPDTGGKQNMKWFEKLKALFAAKELPEGFEDFDPDAVTFADVQPKQTEVKPPEVKPADPPVEPSIEADKMAEFTETIKVTQAENAGLRAKLIEVEANAFFSEALAAGRVFPAEKDSLIAQFKQAVLDDNSGVACFDASGTLRTGDRVKTLRAGIEARPTHKLTTEQLENGEVVILSNNSGAKTGPMTPERKAQLIAAGDIKPQAQEVK